jgi:potassium/hydrogen antiporter
VPSIQFEHFSLEFILLFSSALLVISVLVSRISSSFGIPALLLFLGLGMLAGSEGPGGIPFENYSVAFAVGSVCLAFIIFDGGLRTSWKSVRPILPVGILLSVLGTFVTGLATGVFAHLILNLTWQEALLLGAIVSSTDAAAVFSTLRSKGLSLKGGLKQTLEFEAGSNDPVAVFLTIAVLTFFASSTSGASSILILFIKQTGLGLVFGWYGGRIYRGLVNKAGVEFEGLYGVLMVGLVIVLFSATSYVGGSGFLAVYVAGLVLGNADYLHKSTIIRFVDGVAWISQILIFLVLGLLVFPSKLLGVWKEGLLLALFMTFAARPLSVFIATPGRLLDQRSRLFVSWIGLRGAAPIILATLPWSMGFEKGEYFFDLVFFIVLFSVVLQGATIPWVATKLDVIEPAREEPTPETGSLLPSGFVAIEAKVTENSSAHEKRIVDLGLPSGVLLTSLERDGRYLVPEGKTFLLAGDRVKGFARPNQIGELKTIFGQVEMFER